MPGGDVIDEGADRRVAGSGGKVSPLWSAAAIRPRDQADRSAFDIALAAGDLAGEAQPRIGFQSKSLVEHFWRIQKRIAVQAAEPREIGVFKARNGAENLDLRAMFQLGLESHHIVERAERIILAQLTTA